MAADRETTADDAPVHQTRRPTIEVRGDIICGNGSLRSSAVRGRVSPDVLGDRVVCDDCGGIVYADLIPSADGRFLCPECAPAQMELAHTPSGATAMMQVVAYTDGACIGNPGPGGWGVYVEYPDGRTVELGGGEKFSTNNKMELRAAIEAVLATLDAPAVTIVTDSEYVQKGITQWIKGWKRNGWITASGKPVENQDLWTELDAVTDPRKLTWEWRRGHAGDPGNERAHEIACSWAMSAHARMGTRSV